MNFYNKNKIMKIVFLHALVGSKNNFEYMEKEFSGYQTMSFDLIGFGKEVKPNINYALDDFMKFLDLKLQLFLKEKVEESNIGKLKEGIYQKNKTYLKKKL